VGAGHAVEGRRLRR
jgi:hypothetical protein